MYDETQARTGLGKDCVMLICLVVVTALSLLGSREIRAQIQVLCPHYIREPILVGLPLRCKDPQRNVAVTFRILVPSLLIRQTIWSNGLSDLSIDSMDRLPVVRTVSTCSDSKE